MLSQPKPRRTYGPRFAAEMLERWEAVSAKNHALSGETPNLRANAPAREIGTHAEQDHGFQGSRVARGYSAKDCEVERLDDKFLAYPCPAGSMSSYKARAAQNSSNTNGEKYPLAKLQNPTNNPEVAHLLDLYGDIRGVMLKHPFFKRIQKPIAEGGWGTNLAGLIYLAKTYGLERVLWAAKAAKQYQGARDKGSIFNHAVRNGMEKEH